MCRCRVPSKRGARKRVSSRQKVSSKSEAIRYMLNLADSRYNTVFDGNTSTRTMRVERQANNLCCVTTVCVV